MDWHYNDTAIRLRVTSRKRNSPEAAKKNKCQQLKIEFQIHSKILSE